MSNLFVRSPIALVVHQAVLGGFLVQLSKIASQHCFKAVVTQQTACTEMDVSVGKYGPWVLQGPPNLERAPPTPARDVKLRLFCVPQVSRTVPYDLVVVGLTL
jgi:hypothetical protein